ncbi:Photosystem II 5 kDa protein [Hibiscus syriacus]|uniref:Photosystem II 5 kDa protein n=1 Tax=Hibiscus syriacus TaxID=106335 RepID=A0A6A2YAX1_HIBSY|nr:photosystem II 5 kDa protein, chloroplastic-like [Hibiscus syriacus]KAE8679825.1 Photosystem II 5 kDa protein [Hibiscus syriacus]
MASITMTAPFLCATSLTKGTPRNGQRRLVVVAKAAKGAEVEGVQLSGETNNGRRELMLAAAAAALCSVAGVAMAEPKPGSSEAKKAYAPVCVTMPTARVCRN